MQHLFRAIPIVSFCFLLLFGGKSLINSSAADPFVYGDLLPDAPALAARGDYAVGVRTIKMVNEDQVDILNSTADEEARYDRELMAEVWYPAELTDGAEELTTYNEVMGTAGDPTRPLKPFTFAGRAARDAKPITSEGAFPLVIVSHGYVGSRYLMTYLTENLASKGYIVVALDHTESTFRDASPFSMTLLNRSQDVLFALNEMAKLGTTTPNNFLNGIVDADRTALIGYSMGGYGSLNAAGAGYSEGAVKFFTGMTKGSNALAVRGHSHPDYRATVDPRIKAVVAFAPWGRRENVWDAEGMKGLRVPTFFVAGSEDDISGYEKGIKLLYEEAVNADRYLLTYDNARHNVAPNPPPAESLEPGLHFDEYYRYAEPGWDERNINNINQHFVTAFLGVHLKDKDYQNYLDLAPNSNEQTWEGFKPRSGTGMELLRANAD